MNHKKIGLETLYAQNLLMNQKYSAFFHPESCHIHVQSMKYGADLEFKHENSMLFTRY
jgi:hypothetical protein